MDAILDMVLARDEVFVEALVIENNLGLCDQELIQFELKGRGKKPKTTKPVSSGFWFQKGQVRRN